MEEVEGVEDEIAFSALQCFDQGGKARSPGFRLHDDFSVDERRFYRQARSCLRDAGETLGPIEPLSRQEFAFALLYPCLDAIAVIFDFMSPVRTARRLIVGLEEEPGLLLFARLARHAHQMPGAF